MALDIPHLRFPVAAVHDREKAIDWLPVLCATSPLRATNQLHLSGLMAWLPAASVRHPHGPLADSHGRMAALK